LLGNSLFYFNKFLHLIVAIPCIFVEDGIQKNNTQKRKRALFVEQASMVIFWSCKAVAQCRKW
jgi:hypothetical protein